jgi:RNA polymerase sigma-70 factor (ECF subfamily)
VGDVFAKFMEQLAKGKGPLNNLRSYLFEITYNSIIDEIRYISHQASIDLVDSYSYGKFSVNPDIEKKLDLEKVSQAVQNLSPTQQHVIILRFLEGFSIGETASILGKTISWVKVMQFRAIRNLRLALGMDSSVSLKSSKLTLTLDPSLNHVP